MVLVMVVGSIALLHCGSKPPINNPHPSWYLESSNNQPLSVVNPKRIVTRVWTEDRVLRDVWDMPTATSKGQILTPLHIKQRSLLVNSTAMVRGWG